MNGPENDKLAQFVKSLVAACVRNNTSLEDIHAGIFPRTKTGDYSDIKVVTPYGEIPWDGVSRISNAEMKKLMIEIVNNLFTILNDTMIVHSLTESESIVINFLSLGSTSNWNDPQMVPALTEAIQMIKTQFESVDPSH